MGSEQDDVRTRAGKLFEPPFRHGGGYIWDANGETVADRRGENGSVLRVRGWGRLTHIAKSEDEAVALQDACGEMIAEAMTAYWNRRASNADMAELLVDMYTHFMYGGMARDHGGDSDWATLAARLRVIVDRIRAASPDRAADTKGDRDVGR